jgi:hypothetical protein
VKHFHEGSAGNAREFSLKSRIGEVRPFLYYSFGNFVEKSPSSQLDDHINFSLSVPSSTLQTKRDTVATDILRILFFATNWPERVGQEADINALLDDGYKFNFWPSRTQ